MLSIFFRNIHLWNYYLVGQLWRCWCFWTSSTTSNRHAAQYQPDSSQNSRIYHRWSAPRRNYGPIQFYSCFGSWRRREIQCSNWRSNFKKVYNWPTFSQISFFFLSAPDVVRQQVCVSTMGFIIALVITALLALVAVAVAVSCWLMAYRKKPKIDGPLPHPAEFPNPLFTTPEPLTEPSPDYLS